MTKHADTGDAIPDIAMQLPDGSSVKPSDYLGRKLVLFFYPKDNTPGCTIENRDFTALADEFERAGTALIGISKDSAKKHQNFIAKHGLRAPLATDPESDGLSDALGIWTEKSMFGHKYMGMERTTYLIDASGKIARIWRKVKVKGHAQEVLEAAQALGT